MEHKILVANRSEIACRIFQCAREMEIPTVGIYTRQDHQARHVTFADEVIEVQSYLDSEEIVSAAKKNGITMIHPGYGFLSERPEFVRAVEKNKMAFIGPVAKTMEMMGEKIAAKKTAEDNKIPTLPWAIAKDLKEIKKEARKIGYPLLLKASAGGGGKGMRRVDQEADLEFASQSASSEAKTSFGDGKLFLEKYVDRSRHVEVQIFGDGQGDGVHLFERECSMQRRHQKVWEESPAVKLQEKTKKKLYEAALRLVKATNYRSAGTVEFLVDEEENFYFLEMNTRLQVEHPVTENVTGVDLVRMQLELALQGSAYKLPKPEKIRGHSIEVRLYAEDPSQNFMPSPGKIEKLIWPTGTGIRIESGIEEGQEIGTEFDPMLAKLVVTGVDRSHCIKRLRYALEETVLLGVGTNQSFLMAMCEHKDVLNGDVHTRFLDENMDELNNKTSSEVLEWTAGFPTHQSHSFLKNSSSAYPSPWFSTEGKKN